MIDCKLIGSELCYHCICPSNHSKCISTLVYLYLYRNNLDKNSLVGYLKLNFYNGNIKQIKIVINKYFPRYINTLENFLVLK
jgi:hypothetical protein